LSVLKAIEKRYVGFNRYFVSNNIYIF